MHDNSHGGGGSPRMTRPWAYKVVGLAATGAVLVSGATAAIAATQGGSAAAAAQGPSIKLVALNPKAGDVAGKHGDFTVALMATAQNAAETAPCRQPTATGRAQPSARCDVRPRAA